MKIRGQGQQVGRRHQQVDHVERKYKQAKQQRRQQHRQHQPERRVDHRASGGNKPGITPMARDGSPEILPRAGGEAA